MIPITDNTITAIAALIYNYAYDQDPDSGWMPESGEPGGAENDWIPWSKCLIQTLQEMPEAGDEQIIARAQDNMHLNHFWNTIWMHETVDEDGKYSNVYSTMTEKTLNVLSMIRDFLAHPGMHPESSFLDRDPDYLAWLEQPIEKE